MRRNETLADADRTVKTSEVSVVVKNLASMCFRFCASQQLSPDGRVCSENCG